MHGDNREGDISFESLENAGIQEKGTNKSLFRNWPLMSAVILYCIFSLHDMAYSEVFSLWAVSSKTFGLGFSTNKVGVVLTISGGGLLLFQTFLYPLIERILGPVMVSRVAAVLSVPVLQSYPFIAMLSGFSFLILLNCASMLMNVLTIVIATRLSVRHNNAVDQKQRGAANGIAMTGMSLFRGLGPPIGGFLSFQVGREKFLIPWLLLINRKSSEVPMIDVHLRYSGSDLHGVTAKVIDKPHHCCLSPWSMQLRSNKQSLGWACGVLKHSCTTFFVYVLFLGMARSTRKQPRAVWRKVLTIPRKRWSVLSAFLKR